MDENRSQYEPVSSSLLPHGMGFFETMEREKDRFDEDWCVVDIQVGQRELFIKWFGTDGIKSLFMDIRDYLKETAAEKGGFAEYFGMEHFCMIVPFDIVELNGLQEKVQEMIADFTGLSGFIPVFGIALMDGSCDTVSGYFNQAALSCEGITDSSKHRVNVYDAQLKEMIEEEYRILKSFQEALDKEEICFWLQPQYRVVNRKIVGAEALARWITTSGSFISPGVFIPILEKHRIVSRLDTFIWEEVCKWIRKRLDEGHVLIPVSVNLSRADILSMDVPEFFENLLEKYDLPRNSIKIEVTESAYVDSFSSVGNVVSQLQKNGFMVLMDDFGSGYSSLNMLNKMNVDLIKLDAQFLNNAEDEERKGINILESVVNMTRNLSMPIIVEGVETDEQARFLSDLGCRYAQGYYFSRPMSVQAFEALVRDESIIDTGGFVFKANQQLHAREFLDDHIYSDAMLNNILGPVVFVNCSGDLVDIIRFNDQFYQMMGVSIEVFESLRHNVREILYPDDWTKLTGLFESAFQHHTVGARGIVRTCRRDGRLRWLSLKIYFLNEDIQGKKYYVSAQDVSDLMNMHDQMRILSDCLNDTILFLHRTPEGLIYESVVHGLSDDIGLDADTLVKALNSGEFCRWVEGYRDIPHSEYTELFMSQLAGGQRELKVNIENGKSVRLIVRADRVVDDKSDTEYIVVMRLAE